MKHFRDEEVAFYFNDLKHFIYFDKFLNQSFLLHF